MTTSAGSPVDPPAEALSTQIVRTQAINRTTVLALEVGEAQSYSVGAHIAATTSFRVRPGNPAAPRP